MFSAIIGTLIAIIMIVIGITYFQFPYVLILLVFVSMIWARTYNFMKQRKKENELLKDRKENPTLPKGWNDKEGVS